MEILVGHNNMDLDCIGSVILAKYLFPGHVPVKSRRFHPMAANAENLFKYRIGFINPKELKGKNVEHAVVLDTRVRARVEESFQYIGNSDMHIEIFDHHPGPVEGFENALLHESGDGANTTQLAIRLLKKNIALSQDDATLALAAIYADTGNFRHENVTRNDFAAAAFLLDQGASLKMVNTLLKPLKDKDQFDLFHDVMNRLEYVAISGHRIVFSFQELAEECSGIGAVVERVFDVEDQDAYFGVFHFRNNNKTLIIGRSQNDAINLHDILVRFGGGGHSKAASAAIKNRDGRTVYSTLRHLLHLLLEPGVCAADIMTRDVVWIPDSATLLEASLLLEEKDLTGMPVLGADRVMRGFLTLRDIMKGRRGNQMHSSVTAYMSTRPITGKPDLSLREIEDIFFSNGIGHLPILDNGRLVGIVTRSDYIKTRKKVEEKMNTPGLAGL